MKKLFSWAWGLIPLPMQVWAVGFAIVALLGALWGIYHRIEQKGYYRCEVSHVAAAAKAKDDARAKIIPSGRKYEKIKSEVAREPGLNDPVGPRVTLAIDRLPTPPAGDRQ